MRRDPGSNEGPRSAAQETGRRAILAILVPLFTVLGTCVAGSLARAQECGDRYCDTAAGENRETCAADCYCGNGTCDLGTGEDCGTCLQDCPCWDPAYPVCVNRQCVAPNPCGDGSCDTAAGENYETCAADCYCGNGTCDLGTGEDCGTCLQDCPCGDPAYPVCVNRQCVAPNPCGDGSCNTAAGENYETCATDCYCGNGTCDLGTGEDCGTCLQDCPCWDPAYPVCENRQCVAAHACGDGRCDTGAGEDYGTCAADCYCGNGTCDLGTGEDCGACLPDCPCAEGTGCVQRECRPPQCGTATCEDGCALKPTFGLSTTRPNANQEVVFTATLEFIDDPSPKWDLGNGVHLEGSTLAYRYPRPGTYHVILTATDRRCHTPQLSDPVSITVSGCGDGTCEMGEESACQVDCGHCRLVCAPPMPDGDDCHYECTDTADAAVLAAHLPTELAGGQLYEASITLANTGNTTWSAAAGYALAAVGGEDPFTSQLRLDLPAGVVVPPQWSHTYRFTMEGPPGTGSAVTDWRMSRGTEAFGPVVQATVTYSEGGGGGGSGGGAALLVRLDNGDLVLVDNASGYSAEEIRSFVLRADRSTRTDCTDVPIADGLIDERDKLFISNHYLAWFDYTLQPAEASPWAYPWHRSGALAGWWSLNPTSRDFRYKRVGPHCAGWAHNELIPGSASPSGERLHWDKPAPPTEQCMCVCDPGASCPHPCSGHFYCYNYSGLTSSWRPITGLDPVSGGVRYATLGRMTRWGDWSAVLPGGGFIDARVEYVCRPRDIRVIWKFKPSRDVDVNNIFMYLWPAYAQNMEACSAPGMEWPETVFGQPLCHRSTLRTIRNLDGRVFPPETTVPMTLEPPCAGRNQDLYGSTPGSGDWVSLSECGGASSGWQFAVAGAAGSGSGTEDDAERIAWHRMLSWNENTADGTLGLGVDSMESTTHFVGGRWYVGEHILRAESGGTAQDLPNNQPPVAHAGGPYATTPGLPLALDGTASYDPEADIAGYVWAFGDGATGEGARPTHTYAAPGSYRVSLSVRDAGGLASTATSLVTISHPNQAPTVSIGGPDSCTTPCSLSLAASATDPDGDPVAYSWSGCAGGSAASATCSITSPGSHLASVTVKDGREGTASASKTISVGVRGDIDGDNQPDLLWQERAGLNARVWAMNGLTRTAEVTPTPATTPGVNQKIVAIGDFDGDDRSDWLVQRNAAAKIFVYYMDGVTAKPPGYPIFVADTPNGDQNWMVVGAPDLNHDGKPDLLLQHQLDGTLQVWYLDGITVTSTGTINGLPANGPNPKIVSVDDFNGDGNADLLYQRPFTGKMFVAYLNGVDCISQVFLTPAFASTDPNDQVNWRVVGSGDYNGDGKPDLLFKHELTGVLKAWLMNGATRDQELSPTPDRFDPANPTASIEWWVYGNFAWYRGRVATPVIAPMAGTFTGPIDVTVTAWTGSAVPWTGATLRYTTNGADPDNLSPIYTGPLFLDQNLASLKAQASMFGWVSSMIAAAGPYTFTGANRAPDLRLGDYPPGNSDHLPWRDRWRQHSIHD